jgi:hypothetical protein
MRKQSKPSLNDVSMFAFSSTILLMSMWTRYTMRNAKAIKERMEFFILPTPISLNMQDFAIKKTLNMFLKLSKDSKNFRLMLEQI